MPIPSEPDHNEPIVPRRNFLWRSGGGLGAIALGWLLSREARAAGDERQRHGGLHFAPRARRVLHVFACGGMSHVDTFDQKPALDRLHGQELNVPGKVDTFFGRPGRLLKSPFEFKPAGRLGLGVSSLFPHVAARVDDICFIHSMTARTSNHTPATFQMNSGFTMNGFPAMGSWIAYGLGNLTEELPAYVVMTDPRGLPAGGAVNWTSGFLPASHQGVAFRSSGSPVENIATPPKVTPEARRTSLEFLSRMNREFLDSQPGDSTLAARVKSYELAARMQMSIPEAADLDGESAATRTLYGLDDAVTAGMGRNCLLARRLLERGVRFVHLFHGGAFGSPRINWDAHENVVENHTAQAATLDRPLAGLLEDLKARGMMDDTLVVFTSEFGRTPFTEGIDGKGRDHHQLVFTVWLAGAGVKPGFRFGSSDDVGYHPAENPVTVPDLHATILHLLGLDHKRLTHYHNGIQRRLTDVHGEVIHGILA